MRVISKSRLAAFYARHPDSKEALLAWFKVMERNTPRSFPQLRKMFNTVDIVDALHVFDVRGNRYRLVCGVSYSTQQCFVKHVLTHVEYDRGKWK